MKPLRPRNSAHVVLVTGPYACGYCGTLVTLDNHGSFVDETDGDCCSGDVDGANENGVHTVAIDRLLGGMA